MNLREKILAGVGGAIIFGWWISPTLYSYFLEPFDRAKFEITGLKSELTKLQDKEIELIKATAHFKDAQAISLPPDPIDAQRLYQKWLTEVANVCKFKDISIVPKRRTTKGDIYTSVQVSIDARASFMELTRFLELFNKANLLHRISELNLTSNSASDDAPLSIHITAEGLSLPKVPARDALFPRTKMSQPLKSNASLVTVDKVETLPKTVPYLLKVEDELIEVSAANGNQLTVIRGAYNTKPVDHTVDAQVELFPEKKNKPGLPAEIQTKLAKFNPFLKYQPAVVAPPPVIKKPKLKSLADLNILQGDPLKQPVKIDDWRPELGKVQYTLKAETLPDLKIDPETGEISLPATDTLLPDSYTVSVQVNSELDPEFKLTGSFRVNVKQMNHPPVFEVDSPLTAFQEQPYKLRLSAKDEDTKQKLTYSLGTTRIPNVTINPDTGLVEFKPGLELAPGVYPLEVKVTDSANPPATATQTLEIPISEDHGKYTYLVANILDGDNKVIWLYNRLENVRYELKEMDLFAVADLFGVVGKIEYDYIVLGIDGDLYKLKTGHNLREMERLPAPPAEPSDSESMSKTEKTSLPDSEMKLPPPPDLPE